MGFGAVEFRNLEASRLGRFPRRGTKKNQKKNEFLRHQAVAVTLKLQQFTVTLCVHRFCFENLYKFFFKSMLKDLEKRCVLPLVNIPG